MRGPLPPSRQAACSMLLVSSVAAERGRPDRPQKPTCSLWWLPMLITVATSALAQAPPKENGDIVIALSPLPSVSRVGDHTVVLRKPEDPEITSLGGSGGPVLHLEVLDDEGAIIGSGTIQAIWLYARNATGAPSFSVWSKTGVSNHVQCRYELKRSKYCASWCQDFEVDDSGTHRVGEPRHHEDCPGQGE